MMNNIIKTKQWRSIQSTEILEQRTYKSGHIRYYVKGYKSWNQVERSLAEDHWIKDKLFLTANEYIKYKNDESVQMIHRFNLVQAQKIGKGK